jgi:hypothetical protein
MSGPGADAQPATHRRHRRPEHRAVVVGIVAAAAVAAAVLSSAAPTGWAPVDVVYRALFAGVVTMASVRARRWTLIWAAALASAAAGGWVAVPAGVALAGGIALQVLHRRDRWARAAVGGTAAVSLLMLEWPPFVLGSALVAAVAVAPVLATGYLRMHHRNRPYVWAGLGAAVLLLVLGLVTTGLFAATAAPAVASGVRNAADAVEGLGNDTAGSTQQQFAQAADDFARAGQVGDAWWLAPARAVPVLAQHVQLGRDATTSGQELGTVAADVSTQVTDERLRRPEGGIDLVRLAALQAPAEQARDSLDTVVGRLELGRSPWILGPVSAKVDEVADKVESARDSADLAAVAAQRAPAMLGADGERRYIVLLGNPAELRDVGGHIGNWAEVVVSNGTIDVRRVGQPYDLYTPNTVPHPNLTPGAYPQSLVELRPDLYPQNWGGSPDLPTVARLVAEIWPQVNGGAQVDGVAYADPTAFAALLELTGPVTVPGTSTRLAADNAVEYLTRTQFAEIRQTGDDGDPLGEVIRTSLTNFTSSQLPSPGSLGEVFGPVVAGGHLQLATLHPEDDDLLTRTLLLGEVERPGAGDLLAVVSRNVNPSKIDAYLQRAVDYDVAWNVATGETRGVLTVKLSNTAPADGLPDVVLNGPEGTPNGTNRTQLCVLSPLKVRSVYLDGERTGVGTLPELRGVDRHCLFVDLAAGSTHTVKFNLLGDLGAGVPYLLQWVGQSTVGPDTARLSVQADRTSVDGGKARVSIPLDPAEDELVTVTPDVLGAAK